MKRAGDDAPDTLEPLPVRVCLLPGLIERRRGVFYRKDSAFLHLHQDVEDVFADIKLSCDTEFSRFHVSMVAERKIFIAAARKAIAP